MRQFEYKVLDTGRDIERELNELGAQGWQVVGVTTKKQLFIGPPQAIVLMRDDVSREVRLQQADKRQLDALLLFSRQATEPTPG